MADNESFEKENNKNIHHHHQHEDGTQHTSNPTHVELKHLNENYDAHLDTILPEQLHRGDIHSVNRFLGYHDAMMATCGTFLVLPLRNLNKMVTDEDLKHGGHDLPHDPIHANTLAEYLDAMKLEIIMFFLGFLIVCTMWETNNIRTIVMKRFDDFMILLGILQMFATVVFPFSMTLQGHYPEETITIILTAATLIFINILELIMTVYAFSCPRLLHLALASWDKSLRRRFMITMCIKPVFDILLIAVASAFTLLDYRVTWFLLIFLVLWPLVRKLIFYLRRRIVHESKQEKCRFFWYFTKGQISKERVEAFTDAAVAIIACVLILDITVEEFPTFEKVKKDGLLSVLDHMKLEFITFFGTYLGVSLLWYVNHTVLHLFHTIDCIGLYLQKIFLAFLCMAPLMNNMLTKFGSQEATQDTKVAVLWTFGMSFAASITQFLMLIWGYWNKEKMLHQWAARPSRKDSMNKNQFQYIQLKTLTIPFWTFVGLFGYFGNGYTPLILTLVCIVMTWLTFFIIKFIYMNHVGKEGVSNFLKLHHQVSVTEMQISKEMQSEMNDGQVEFDTEDDFEKEVIQQNGGGDKIEKQVYVDAMKEELEEGDTGL